MFCLCKVIILVCNFFCNNVQVHEEKHHVAIDNIYSIQKYVSNIQFSFRSKHFIKRKKQNNTVQYFVLIFNN